MTGGRGRIRRSRDFVQHWRSRALVRDVAWVTMGQVVSSLAVLVGTRVLTEFIPPAVYGSATLLAGTATLAATLTTTPLLQAAMRFYPQIAAAGRIAVFRSEISGMLRAICTAMIALVLIAGGGYALSHHESLAMPVIVALLTVAEISKTYYFSLLSAAREQRRYAIWIIGESALRPVFAFAAVRLFHADVASVLGAYLVASGLLLLVLRMGSVDDVQPTGPDDRRAMRGDIKRYALPLIPLAIVGWVSGASDRYVVGYLLGMAQAGIYAASYGLISRPFSLMSSILLTTLRPVYFRLVAEGHREQAARLHRQWVLVSLALLVTGILLIALLREVIVALFLARGYRASAALMPWFAVGGALLAMANVYNTSNLVHHRVWAVTRSEIAAAVASLAFGIPLTRIFGLIGTAWAVPIYYAVQLLFAWWPTWVNGARDRSALSSTTPHLVGAE